MYKQSAYSIIGAFFVCSIIGYFLIPQLNVRLSPSRTSPSINVNYGYYGASAKTIDLQVTSLLEASLSTLEQIKQISSTSNKGNGNITIEFEKNTDLDFLRFEVSSKMRQSFASLPTGVSYPNIRVNQPKESENRGPFLIYTLNAPTNTVEINQFASNFILPELSSIDGVSSVNISGANEFEYAIKYNLELMRQLNLNKSDLVEAIKTQYKNESLGYAMFNAEQLEIRLAQNQRVNLWQIPLKKVDNKIIYLTDVCTITKKEQDARSFFRINGENALRLSLEAENGANTIQVAKKTEQAIEELRKQLPNKYSITQSYNATDFVNKELQQITKRSVLTVIILLLFVLLVTRSFRYLIIVVLSLTVNIGVAIIFYYLFKVEIQLFSLAGVTISLGLIIDNTIVMIDHIKKSKNNHVFLPILAATLTTIGALSIIYFLDEQLKLNLIDFAYVVVINLVISLFVALFFIPSLLTKFPLQNKNEKQQKENRLTSSFYMFYEKLILKLIRFKWLVFTITILGFGLPLFMLPQQWSIDGRFGETTKTWYTKAYNNTFGSQWYNENARPIVDKTTGGALRLFKVYVYEGAYYNRSEETKLFVSARPEEAISLLDFNESMLAIENYLLQFNEVEQFVSNVNTGRGSIEIRFKDQFRDSSFPYILKGRLIRNAIDLGGISWNVYGVGKGFSNPRNSGETANFTLVAKGYNYEQLQQIANEFSDSLLVHPRLQKAETTTENYYAFSKKEDDYIKLNKEQLVLFNYQPNQLLGLLKEQTINLREDVTININEQSSPIRLESDQAYEFDQWEIKHAPLGNKESPIQLASIASFTKEKAEESIKKENQEYIVYVKAQYTGSHRFGDKYIKEQLKKVTPNLPLGYSINQSNNYYYFGDQKSNYTWLLGLIAIIIYFISTVLFNHLKQGFIILSLVPISFIGVFLTFYLFDFNFDQGGMASFILLAGLTVNAAIFIVNDYNEQQKLNLTQTSLSNYLLAFKRKIFAIILTILSTTLGFIPFIVDGQNEVFYFALAVGTIGGLLFSMLGILLLLPLFLVKKGEV